MQKETFPLVSCSSRLTQTLLIVNQFSNSRNFQMFMSAITLFSLLFFITHVASERMLSTITFFPWFFCWRFFLFFQIHSFKCSFSPPLQTALRLLHRESPYFGVVARKPLPLEGAGVSVGI